MIVCLAETIQIPGPRVPDTEPLDFLRCSYASVFESMEIDGGRLNYITPRLIFHSVFSLQRSFLFLGLTF